MVTPFPTPFPTNAPSPSSVLPSATPFDPVLDAALPAEIASAPTYRITRPARDFTVGDMCPWFVCPGETAVFVEALGAPGSDLRIGIAMAQTEPVVVLGFRAPGVSGQVLLDTRIKALAQADPEKTTWRVTAADKILTWAWYSIFLGPTGAEYLYATSDILYVIRYEVGTDVPKDLPPPTPREVIAAAEALP